jgi:hypothetical protein
MISKNEIMRRRPNPPILEFIAKLDAGQKYKTQVNLPLFSGST